LWRFYRHCYCCYVQYISTNILKNQKLRKAKLPEWTVFLKRETMNLIEVINLNKVFQVGKKNLTVISDANLSIKEGDFVIILGPSGSGKTTLLNMISGLDKPTSGSIYINGEDITQLRRGEIDDWRRDYIGIIFQSYNLMPYMNSIDNIALPLVFQGMGRKERRKKALSLIKCVGLTERAYQNTNYLSGGEQQRVTIARALVNNPPILIADEPTGDLDIANATEVMEILFSLYKERKTTILMSTHNANYSKYADKVIYIQKGEVTTQRSPK